MDLLEAYETLGLPIGASAEVSKITYRKLRAYWHPDKNSSHPQAGEKFGHVREAYKLLERAGFPDAQSALHRSSRTAKREHEEEAPKKKNGDDWYYGYYREAANSGHGKAGDAGPHRQVARTIKLSLEEAAFGTVATLQGKVRLPCKSCAGKKYTGEKLCPECAGRAFVNTARVEYDESGRPSTTYACIACEGRGTLRQKCGACAGTGTQQASSEYTIRVRIPAGVTDGSELVVKGVSNSATGSTLPNDVKITIELKDHDIYWFDSDGYLCCSVPVSLLEYVAQETIAVPTLWGEEAVTLRPGCRMVELKRHGFPGRSGERFPMRVHIEVEERPLPEAQLAKLRKAIKAVQTSHRHQSRAQREWNSKVDAWRSVRGAQSQ